MSLCRCNDTGIKDFVESFSPIEKKYVLNDWDEEKKRELWKHVGKCRDVLGDELWKLPEIEDTYLTIEKVYGEEKQEWGRIVEQASEKFLGEYVNIEGVCQLFKSSYFYFEWMMHLEYNKDSHNYTYYRDHYVHQVRNMYEMFMFLDELDFENRCRHIYEGLDNEVGRLIRKSIEEEYHSKPGVEWKIWNKMEYREDEIKKLLYRYLFYAATIVASLLHDIGYPIGYVGRTVQELGSFLPFTNLFVEEVKTTATIHSVLQDSLLYRTVGQKEVARQLEKRDHGALSAVVLLYKYYDNGKIASLSPIKRAVIELGAVMIYNHTMHFENMGAKHSHHYKNFFRENPLSYLFRLCDDLQEWDRNYFEISKHSNFFVCGNCFMPLTKDRDEEEKKGEEKKGEKKYSCWCGEGKGINTTTFSYRRLINVDACNELSMELDGAENKNEKMHVSIRYDKRKMLQLAAYSPNYALKRAEGMREIKKMLNRQPGFPNTFLEFFVSNNPIMLKAEIVGDWFAERADSFFVKRQKEYDQADCEDIIKQYQFLCKQCRRMFTKKFENECKKDRWVLENWLGLEALKLAEKGGGSQESIVYIWSKFRFYYTLALIGQLLSRINKKVTSVEKAGTAKIILDLRTLICRHFGIESRDEKDLIEHYMRQKILQYSKEQYYAIKNQEEWKAYCESFIISDSDTNAVKGYIASSKYEEIKTAAIKKAAGEEDTVPIYYDYYSDYYLYYSIAYKQECERLEES